jgi:hypothetical protein
MNIQTSQVVHYVDALSAPSNLFIFSKMYYLNSLCYSLRPFPLFIEWKNRKNHVTPTFVWYHPTSYLVDRRFKSRPGNRLFRQIFGGCGFPQLPNEIQGYPKLYLHISFHILSFSLFTNYPPMRRRNYW